MIDAEADKERKLTKTALPVTMGSLSLFHCNADDNMNNKLKLQSLLLPVTTLSYWYLSNHSQ